MVAQILNELNFGNMIKDNSVVAMSGFNMGTTPDYLISGLLDYYKKTGKPKNLFVITDALPASPGRAFDNVMKYIYEENDTQFIRGMLVPFMGFSPYLQKVALEGIIPIYSWPIGLTAYWLREISSGRPGLLTKIGIDTYLDPQNQGGALNENAVKRRECNVREITVDDERTLFFEGPKPDYAFIRASISDPKGNLSVRNEPFKGTIMTMAQAVKAHPNPGKVYAQVLRIMNGGYITPLEVEVPWPLVDYVIRSPPEFHSQASSFNYDPEVSVGNEYIANPEFMEKDRVLDKAGEVIVNEGIRILNETLKGKDRLMINLGVGIPASIGRYIYENNMSDKIVPVVESGPWGGVTLSGADFGVCKGFFAVSTIPDMFSNYEGGIIDAAALGFLQIDSVGNVNPSILKDRITGPGGFPVIAQGTPVAIFMGKFMAGKMDIDVNNGLLNIKKDGQGIKFVKDVYRILFSGRQASIHGKKVIYITERAEFELGKDGLILTRIAPGVDLDKDILGKMEFKPEISKNLKDLDL
ncbi:CoA-transferase [Cuniculiplasma sp. SKW3]|uniref:CoA-transferase n=1 Tax=Cuniculiplasma sp. SKW3 TaxID=3400170 RepID=UPI003FD56188